MKEVKSRRDYVVTLEEWTDLEKTPFDNEYEVHLQIKNLYTSKVIDVLETLLPTFINEDDHLEVIHYRKKQSIQYVTYIKGEYFTIEIKDGLTSGYNGEGSNGLEYVLRRLGFSETLAAIVYDKKYDSAVIRIRK
ncbi:hypothetical protein [Oceanobacillus oncorhynchi]|uniref:hypothetical protein n=1 Tax=Oceanobacillus oncorhynchi TaxID=545501 RepID=UPI0018691875|nr:hypothetical protein [Oceanobacillus oncorhynchi]